MLNKRAITYQLLTIEFKLWYNNMTLRNQGHVFLERLSTCLFKNRVVLDFRSLVNTGQVYFLLFNMIRFIRVKRR